MTDPAVRSATAGCGEKPKSRERILGSVAPSPQVPQNGAFWLWKVDLWTQGCIFSFFSAHGVTQKQMGRMDSR